MLQIIIKVLMNKFIVHITIKFYVKCQIKSEHTHSQTQRHTTGMINKSMKISNCYLVFYFAQLAIIFLISGVI